MPNFYCEYYGERFSNTRNLTSKIGRQRFFTDINKVCKIGNFKSLDKIIINIIFII